MPPYWRAVDASACANGLEELRLLRRASMPMPVSRTEQRSRSFTGPRSRETWIETSPVAVNLIAFDTRFASAWRMRPGSPMHALGHVGADIHDQLELLRPRCGARPASSRLPRRGRAGRISIRSSSSLPASILEIVEDVVDDDEQRVGARADDARVLALRGGRGRCRAGCRHADHAVHRRADFVAHVGQELAAGAAGRLGLLSRLGERGLQFRELPLKICDSRCRRGSFRLAHRDAVHIIPGRRRPTNCR